MGVSERSCPCQWASELQVEQGRALVTKSGRDFINLHAITPSSWGSQLAAVYILLRLAAWDSSNKSSVFGSQYLWFQCGQGVFLCFCACMCQWLRRLAFGISSNHMCKHLQVKHTTTYDSKLSSTAILCVVKVFSAAGIRHRKWGLQANEDWHFDLTATCRFCMFGKKM